MLFANEYIVLYIHQYVLNMVHLLHICVKKEFGERLIVKVRTIQSEWNSMQSFWDPKNSRIGTAVVLLANY